LLLEGPMRAIAMAAVLGFVLLPGCGTPDTVSEVHAAASLDFACPSDAIKFVEVGEFGCAKCSGAISVEYRATGCHHTGTYTCDLRSNDDGCRLMGGATSESATLTINGVPFDPDGVDGCHSGEAEGEAFYGVDLRAPGGDTLRIVRAVDLSFQIVAISGTDHSPAMSNCATVTMGSGAHGGLSGSAQIDCSSGTWAVKGYVSFDGCD
jgi:hypothetical protein